jgi:hypothetical protein
MDVVMLVRESQVINLFENTGVEELDSFEVEYVKPGQIQSSILLQILINTFCPEHLQLSNVEFERKFRAAIEEFHAKQKELDVFQLYGMILTDLKNTEYIYKVIQDCFSFDFAVEKASDILFIKCLDLLLSDLSDNLQAISKELAS